MQHILIFNRDPNQQGTPGWSFALTCKFEFWAHVMESMQNAKLYSSASIGREKGGPLLGGIPVKNNVCCMFCLSGVKHIYFLTGILPNRRPPLQNARVALRICKVDISICEEVRANNIGFP